MFLVSDVVMDGDDSFHLPSDEEFEIDGNLNVVVKESSDDEDADDPAPQGGHDPAGEVSAGMHPDKTTDDGGNNNGSTSTDSNLGYPSWKNETLFPPERKRKATPSLVWKFGGFKRVGGKLSNMITCGLCGKSYKYENNSPGNFGNHIKIEHSEEWKKADGGSKSCQTKMSDFAIKSSNIQVKKYPSNHPKQIRFRRTLIEWIIHSLRPFIIVEDRKFVELIEIADDKLHVVCADTLASDINKMYKEQFDLTVEGFESVSFVTCTTDAGSSYAGKSYINVNVHWIDENTFEMKRKLIQVVRAVSKKAEDYRKVVDDALIEHNLLSKCFIFITDNENTMAATFSGHEERNGCFAHIESKASQKALESSEKLKETRERLKKLAKKSNKSDHFKTYIEQEQIAANLKPRSLKQEVDTRFTATHTMFSSFLNDQNEKGDDEEYMNMEKIEANIDAINRALKKVLPTNKPEQYNELCVRPEDVDRMIKLIPTLDVLEEGITLLGADKYNTGSSVVPFVVNFKDILQDDDEDVGYVRTFKKVLWEELEERCRKNLNFHVLIKSSFFDKRYSSLGFLSKLQFDKFPLREVYTKEQIVAEIIIEGKALEEKLKEKKSESEEVQNVDKTVTKRKRKSKFLSTICDDKNEETSRQTYNITEEVERYQQEDPISSNDCALKWWYRHKDLYPIMSKLAAKYLSVQATSTAAERAFSTLGNMVTKKRTLLSDEHVQKLSYLKDCI